LFDLGSVFLADRIALGANVLPLQFGNAVAETSLSLFGMGSGLGIVADPISESFGLIEVVNKVIVPATVVLGLGEIRRQFCERGPGRRVIIEAGTLIEDHGSGP